MIQVAGVKFRGTREGEANEGRIPKDGFEDHYLIAAGSKRKSSYLVVDTDGYLRRGSVENAWNHRGQTDRDVEHSIRRLARYFDDPPIPDNAMTVNTNWMEFEDDTSAPDDGDERLLNIEETFAMTASTATDDDFDFSEFEERVGDGFNEYGVRENYADGGDTLESVDVVFEAMEPGPPERRNGVRITEDFLRKVAEKDYADPSQPPHLVDHERSDSFSKVGDVKEVWFSESRGKLMLMARVPNTGSRTHDEAIQRYTHEPPSWRDGSVGFGKQYRAVRNSDGEPELKDGRLREFSTVNFPGGYDEGGIRAAFAEAAVEEAEQFEFDDAADEGTREGDAAENSATAVHSETITF